MKRRRGPTSLRAILAGGLLLLVSVAPALATSNPPSVECESELWNGEYWKIQVNDGELGEIETNVPGAIQHVVFEGNFEWANLHTNDVFWWLFKSGNEVTVPWDGLWTQGEGDSALMPGNLSHVTFCFTDTPPPTTTTTTTTTTTEPPPTTTTTTTTEPPPSTTTTTTTTIPEPTTTTTTTTTVPPSSTTSTTTTTTPTPTTTTTVVTSTSTPPDTQPPTTTSTTRPPGCDENHPTWDPETQTCKLPYTDQAEMAAIAVAGGSMLLLGLLGLLLKMYFREERG